MNKQRTCKDRIEGELKSRLSQMTVDPYDDEDGWGIDGNSVLEVSKSVVYKILLSYGGPADWFNVYVSEGEILKITYCFQDWYDYAELQLKYETFDMVKNWILSNLWIQDLE